MQRPTPISAHAYGEDCARKLPTLNASPWPSGGEYELVHGLWGGRTCEEEVEGDEGGGGSGGYEETGECHRGGVHVQCRGDGNSLCYYAVTPSPLPPAQVASGVTHRFCYYLVLLHLSLVSSTPSPQPCSQTHAPQTSTPPNRVRRRPHRTQQQG